MSADIEAIKKDITRRMEGAVDVLHKEFGGLRTGRANASLLDPIVVEAYGSDMPLNQVGTVSVFELQDHSARARLVKAYSTPAVDDLAEFEKTVVHEDMTAAVEVGPGGFMERVEDLEASVQKYEKATEKLMTFYRSEAALAVDSREKKLGYVRRYDSGRDSVFMQRER